MWKGDLIKAGIESDGYNINIWRGNLTVYGSLTFTGGVEFEGNITIDDEITFEDGAIHEAEITITQTDTVGSLNELLITSTFTKVGAVAHKAIQVDLTYDPATTGTACPVGVSSKVILDGNLTAANSYPGLGWGVQGQIHLATGTTIDGSTYGSPGAVYAGLRGVITGAGTSTFTKGQLCALYAEVQLAQENANDESDFNIYGIYVRNQGVATSTEMAAGIYMDSNSVTGDGANILVGIHLNGTGMNDGILISGDCADNGIEISGACTDSAIQIVTGAFGNGLFINADGTTAINISSNFTGTTGILIAGTSTNAISITGTPATADIALHNGATIMNGAAGVLTITEEAISLAGAVGITGSLGMSDDLVFTIGTTVTNASTKITMEFDETTTGIGQIKVGDLSNAQVLNTNPGSAVVADILNILHSAGAGDCDDLIGRYTKVAVSGNGDSGLTAVGEAQRLYIGTGDDDSVVQEAYAIQPWAKHTGTGTLLAMSAVSAALVLGDGDAFESTNSINAGHFHIKTYGGTANGAVTSSNFDGVMIEVYGNVTGLDSCLHMTNGGTGTDSMIKMTVGGAVNVLEFAAAGDSVVIGGGTYSTADGYFVIKVGGDTYRVPFFTAVD